ncbi:hypothetical protein KP509_29G062600 [Ceratopteris richardii]|uniref:Uncharacterized protein n=1 Tax=Ceratopteris richardii TaxID=49495 RepID=A0A8T2R8V6_CERRI|nr:hypothetical protein KP509_29G062600 [Ceratopteris richardii]
MRVASVRCHGNSERGCRARRRLQGQRAGGGGGTVVGGKAICINGARYRSCYHRILRQGSVCDDRLMYHEGYKGVYIAGAERETERETQRERCRPRLIRGGRQPNAVFSASARLLARCSQCDNVKRRSRRAEHRR